MTELVSVASFAARLGGWPLDALVAGRINSVQVVDDLNALTTCTLQLGAWDAQTGAWLWEDGGPFQIGTIVAIEFGFSGNLATLTSSARAVTPNLASSS